MKNNNGIRHKTRSAAKSGVAKRLVWLVVLVIVVVAAAAYAYLHGLSGGKDTSNPNARTFTVRRSDLTVSVTENGDIKPLNSLIIKSKLEDSTTLIFIVDEGTIITQEDVNNGKILVELDSSEIKQEVTQEQVGFLDCQGDSKAAKEALDIQKKQNESDIEAGKIKVRFALMDLHKYLGESVARRLIAVAEQTPNWHQQVTSYVYDPNLGGEALQQLRQLDSSIELTGAKLARARDKLKGTQELYDSNYAAEIELKGDQLDVKSLETQLEQDQTAKDLYVKYEFAKQAVTLLSGYHESMREFQRIEAKARSMLAQAQVEYDKEQAKYKLAVERLEDKKKQLEACTIRAPAAGEVVYASSMGSSWERRNRPIELGAKIQERQNIISIPDPNAMKVEIKIHETWIDKVHIGQKTRINVTAFPEDTLTGVVLKKAPLADPEEWMNPDLKVYSTDIKIDGTHEALKTGMTAKVEIIIQQLKDILVVPIQTVVNVEGKKVCYVMSAAGVQQRQVETGAFNDNFVEIKSGLSQGEKVMLNPPRLTESASKQQ